MLKCPLHCSFHLSVVNSLTFNWSLEHLQQFWPDKILSKRTFVQCCQGCHLRSRTWKKLCGYKCSKDQRISKDQQVKTVMDTLAFNFGSNNWNNLGRTKSCRNAPLCSAARATTWGQGGGRGGLFRGLGSNFVAQMSGQATRAVISDGTRTDRSPWRS